MEIKAAYPRVNVRGQNNLGKILPEICIQVKTTYPRAPGHILT